MVDGVEVVEGNTVDSWRCTVSLAQSGECQVDVGGMDVTDASDNAIRSLIEERELQVQCRPLTPWEDPTQVVSW